MTTENKTTVSIRWDRVGMTVLGVLFLALDFIRGNYYAMIWEAISIGFMMMYYKELEHRRFVMHQAIALGLVIKVLVSDDDDGDDDGDTTTRA